MSDDSRSGTTFPHLGIFGVIAGKPVEVASAADEFLHPAAPSGHYRATETSYFGFSIPEHRINAEIYIWYHPVLKVMAAGIWIYQGLRGLTLSSDYINHYGYLPMPNDIGDYAIEALGLKIKVLNPLKSIQIDLHDADENVSFSLRSEATMPPAVRPGGFHFTQAMKTSGSLNLRGRKYAIDGYFSRDRSWGQERNEHGLRIPPLTWAVGVFDESYAFHGMGMDSPESKPEWLRRYPVQPGSNLSWGYIYRDRKTYSVKSMRQLTTREPDGLIPRTIEMELIDTGGEKLEAYGVVIARQLWQTWQQMNAWFCLVRWESKRGIAYGDFQDIQYNDFTRHFGR